MYFFNTLKHFYLIKEIHCPLGSSEGSLDVRGNESTTCKHTKAFPSKSNASYLWMGIYNNPRCPELFFSVLFSGAKYKVSSLPFAVVCLSISKILVRVQCQYQIRCYVRTVFKYQKQCYHERAAWDIKPLLSSLFLISITA